MEVFFSFSLAAACFSRQMSISVQLGPLGALLEKEAWFEESCVVGVLESYSMDVEDLGAYATGSGFGV